MPLGTYMRDLLDFQKIDFSKSEIGFAKIDLDQMCYGQCTIVNNWFFTLTFTVMSLHDSSVDTTCEQAGLKCVA